MNLIYKKLSDLTESGQALVVVTVIGVQGEAPGEVGSKMIVTCKGLEAGTVGGGKIEARAIQYSLELLNSSNSKLESKVWNLQTDIGMTCGGEITFLFEPTQVNPWQIAVFGAGHIAQCLVPLLCTLNCRVDCFDSREEWRGKLAPHPKLKSRKIEELDSFLSLADEKTFFVVMTQGHATDVPILENIFRRFSEPRYIGLIGSEIKAKRIKAELQERGICLVSLERLRCPIGLRVGSNDPAEIAISVAAELLQVRGVGGSGTVVLSPNQFHFLPIHSEGAV